MFKNIHKFTKELIESATIGFEYHHVKNNDEPDLIHTSLPTFQQQSIEQSMQFMYIKQASNVYRLPKHQLFGQYYQISTEIELL